MALEVLRSPKVFHARRYQDLIAAAAPVFDRVDLAAVFHRPRRAVLKAQRTGTVLLQRIVDLLRYNTHTIDRLKKIILLTNKHTKK